MRTKLFTVAILATGITIAGVIMHIARAQTVAGPNPFASLQYPIAELGNCSSKDSCRTYCADASHTDACLAFAKAHNLMSEHEVNVAEELARKSLQGPGGCTSLGSCKTYCSNIDHINECLAFAEKTGITPPGGLEQAKRIQAAIASGVKPPACKSKDACDTYCSEPSHMKECITFGKAAGFLKGEELQNAEKVLTAIDKGITPPPCRGRDSCNTYCSASADHMLQCITFAKEAGFMTPKEAEQSQGMMKALQAGVKPPACQGKEACDQYCADPAHVNECTKFAVAAGFMTEKDAEMAQKTGGKGPGGCVGKDACETFCKDPQNQQTCFQFAKDNGMIPPEDLRKMEQGRQMMRQSLEQAPPAVLDCLKNALGSDIMQKLESGTMMASQGIGEKMRQCFEQMIPPQGAQGEGGPGTIRQMHQGEQQGGGQLTPEGIPFKGQMPNGKFPNGGPMMNGQEGNLPGGQMPPNGQPNQGQMPPFEGQGGERGQFQNQQQLQMMPQDGKDNHRGGQGDESNLRKMMQEFQGRFPPNGKLPSDGQPPQGQMPPQGQPPASQIPPMNQMPPAGMTPPSPAPSSGGNLLGAFRTFAQSLGNILTQ